MNKGINPLVGENAGWIVFHPAFFFGFEKNER